MDLLKLVKGIEASLVSYNFIEKFADPEDESVQDILIDLLNGKSFEHPGKLLLNEYLNVEIGSSAGKEKSFTAIIFLGCVEA
jgi:hypothetical protein